MSGESGSVAAGGTGDGRDGAGRRDDRRGGGDDRDGRKEERKSRWDMELDEESGGGKSDGKNSAKGKGKAVIVTQDSKGNTIIGSIAKTSEEPDSKVKVYGNPGHKKCVLCKSLRDHVAHNCPSNVCHKCNLRGHWARECPNNPCGWCDELGHSFAECEKRTGIKRRLPTPEGQLAGETSSPVTSGSGNSSNVGSYSHAVRAKQPRQSKQVAASPVITKVDSILADFKGGANSGMSQETIAQRRASFARRREEIRRQFDRAMARVAEDELQFEEELEDEQEYLEAIQQLQATLALKKQARRARRVGSSAANPLPAPEELTESAQECKGASGPAGTSVSVDAPQSEVGEEPPMVRQLSEQVGMEVRKENEGSIAASSLRVVSGTLDDPVAALEDLNLLGDEGEQETAVSEGDEEILEESDKEESGNQVE